MKQETNPAHTCTSIQEMLSLFLSCCSYATASHVTSAYSPCNVTSPFPQIFSDFIGLDGSVSTEKRQSHIGKSAYEDGILQGFQKLPTPTLLSVARLTNFAVMMLQKEGPWIVIVRISLKLCVVPCNVAHVSFDHTGIMLSHILVVIMFTTDK